MDPSTPTKHSSEADVPGLLCSEDVKLDVPSGQPEGGRPHAVKYMSAPSYQSPLRHHHRAASSTRRVKETLNARSEYSNSEDDGTAQHRINQYLIKQEIGRGSFGAVHLAVDQFGTEYAVKEFSKSRLRKRAQSNLLRRPGGRRRPGALAAGLGFNSPLHRHSTDDTDANNNSLDLIKEEIAIMKKLNHPNLVSLMEVLDDPEEDSLYMVMEMCKKGVVMQVGLDERADPYDEEQCRCWFRDMILGIEYLHAQGIIHRDIKPDNCLVTEDDVLKIVDFGVSEMFEKDAEMRTAKSAGSPAFMPPELCVAKHGYVSGRVADIWSMGVTLYCLVFGKIPFEKTGMIELYDSIRNDPLEVGDDCSEQLKDLLLKLLNKDPEKRICMDDIRKHRWVTKNGTDTLLPTNENVAVIVDPPTEEEVNAAITGNMGRLITVVRAVRRFKQLLFKKRPELMEGILGSASRIVQPPLSMRPSRLRRSKSQDIDDRRPIEGALTAEGVHRDIGITQEGKVLTSSQESFGAGTAAAIGRLHHGLAKYAPERLGKIGPQPPDLPGRVVHENESARSPPPSHTPSVQGFASPVSVTPATRPGSALGYGKGHAHDPLEDHLYLRIGTGSDAADGATSNDDLANPSNYIVSESPKNVDMNVYEAAYQEEIGRILRRKEDGGRRPTLYLTRRVEGNESIRENEHIFDTTRVGSVANDPKVGFARLVERAKQVGDKSERGTRSEENTGDEEKEKQPEQESGEIKEKDKEGLIARGLGRWKDVRSAVDTIRAESRITTPEKGG